MNREKLGETIQSRRKELRITQIDLALISEISTKQLSNIEQGKVSTTIDTLSKLCETLGLSIELKIKGID
ncbi:helix-turn-helix transcriptional regulator [Sulfurovum sp. bin170]|uniref:helix-turn-helix domain-containing protein n=1 Tax=Sulfurovum sp. bin170 TaxID=2695268 RepID=UPI0013DED222|nr:helix-turn-helix transcriptional regulator [Sulfurovum sp. bin170]NEW60065.1 helix-turn-helix transcriptional regulator [Sulfurovum sp. bin170]